MLLPGLLVSTLLWSWVSSSPAPDAAAITPAPALNRRADFPADFIGYSEVGFSTDTWTCDLPYTFATDNVGFAGCCSGSCTIPRACSSNYLIYPGGSSSICPSYCISAMISASSRALTTTTLFDCALVSTNIYLLRSAIESSEVSSTESLTSDPTTITSNTDSSRTTSFIPTSTSSTTDSPTPDPKPGTNKGPIIGGAIGGAFGLIILALIGFFLIRRSQKKQPAPYAQNPQAPYPPPGAPPMVAANAQVPNSPPPFYNAPTSPTNNDPYFAQKSAAVNTAWPVNRSVSPAPHTQPPPHQAQPPQQYAQHPQIPEAGGEQVTVKRPNATELE